MPILSNARHERFAQELAKGKSATEAHAAAGYKPNRGNASTLSNEQSILNRVAEIQGRTAIRAEVTAASLIAEAEEVRQKAMEAGQFAPAIAAIKEKGVLAGVRIEKRENTNRSLTSMTDEELEAIASGRSEDSAATAPGSTLSH
ncbi:MAG: hypothetical protein ABFE07_24145 [Armatimonadia bacterium]